MKVEQVVRFTKEEVRAFRELIGLQGPSDVLPDMMANLAYGKLKIPWIYEAPVILRKLENEMVDSVYAETNYSATLEVIDVKQRKDKIHLVEHLTLHVSEDTKCLFESYAKLVTGGVTYDE